MRNLLILNFVFFGQLSFSQDTENSRRTYFDTTSTGRLSINISPLFLLDSYNGAGYRVGLQFRPLQSISLGADGGGYVESITKVTTNMYHISGYHARFRLAYFLKKRTNYSFGIEYQFKQQNFSYFDSTSIEQAFEANVFKRVHCYNLFLAYDHNFSDRFFLDLQFGVGFRYREIFNTRSDVIEDGSSIAIPWDSSNSQRFTTGQNFLPNFTLAIRFGFSIIRN